MFHLKPDLITDLTIDLFPDLIPDLNPDLTIDLTPDLIQDLTIDLTPDLIQDLTIDLFVNRFHLNRLLDETLQAHIRAGASPHSCQPEPAASHGCQRNAGVRLSSVPLPRKTVRTAWCRR